MIIKDVNREEYERQLKLLESYRAMISQLPKGCINKKKRGNGIYIYLNYREGSKVKSRYIGKSGSDAAEKIVVQIEKRRDIENKLKEVKNNICELERVKKWFQT
jgi:hypothetical protein